MSMMTSAWVLMDAGAEYCDVSSHGFVLSIGLCGVVWWPQLERQRTLKRNFQLLEGLAVSWMASFFCRVPYIIGVHALCNWCPGREGGCGCGVGLYSDIESCGATLVVVGSMGLW